MPELAGICAVSAYDAANTTIGRVRPGLSAVVLRRGNAARLALKGESGVCSSSSCTFELNLQVEQDLYLAGESATYLRPQLAAAAPELASLGRLVCTGLTARILPDDVCPVHVSASSER